MATTNVYFNSSVTGDCTTPNNAVGSGTGTWTADGNSNSNWVHQWDYSDVTGNGSPSGSQVFTFRARKGSNSGTPSISTIEYMDNNNNVLYTDSTGYSVTSTTGQDVVSTVPAGNITSGGAANLRVRITILAAGGSPSVRNSVELDYANWTYQYSASAALTGAAAPTFSTSGTLRAAGFLTGAAAPTFSVGTVTLLEGFQIVTTSSDSVWALSAFTKTGATIHWRAEGSQITTQTLDANIPSFDLSLNSYPNEVTITGTSTDGWSGVTVIDLWNASDPVDSGSHIRELRGIKLMTGLTVLNLRYAKIKSLDVTGMTTIENFIVRGKYQFAVNSGFSAPNYVDTGGDGTIIGFSTLTNLQEVQMDVTGIDHLVLPTTNAITIFKVFDVPQIKGPIHSNEWLANLNANGLSSGTIQINNGAGDNPEHEALADYVALIGKGWTIDVGITALLNGRPIDLKASDCSSSSATNSIGSWTGTSATVSVESTIVPHWESYSLKVVATATSGSYGSLSFSVTSGKTYTVKGYAYIPAQSDQAVSLPSADGWSTNEVYAADANGEGVFRYFTLTAVANASTASIRVWAADTTGAVNDEIYVTGLIVEQQGNNVAGSSADPTFSTSGTLYNASTNDPLVGEANVTFSTSGVLNGIGILIGSGDPIFSTAGILEGTGELTASADPTFSTSGVLKGMALLSGAADPTFSSSGVLNGIGTLTASADPTFSATGTIQGISPLTGASDPTFSTLGVLQGIAPLVGAADPTFSTSGTVDGIGSLTGNADPTFSATGILDGIGTLTGTADPTFSTSGTLTSAGSIGYLTGAASPTFSTAGVLDGVGGLTGLSDPTFTTAGVLSGTGELTGASSPTFSTSCTLQALTPLTGVVDPTFSTVGVLSATGGLTGVADPAFSTAGTMTGTASLTGAANPIFTTAGVLSGGSGLAGSADVAFSTSGVLSATGELTGAGSPTFSTSGTLVAKGYLTGASDPIFTTAGVLAGTGTLTGSADPTFSTSAVLTGGDQLWGAANVEFSTSGVLEGVASLTGTSSPTFSTSGTLTATAPLTGTSSPTFSTSGILSATGGLTGSADPQFNTTSILGGTGILTASADPTFSTSGILNTGPSLLIGSANITFSTVGILGGITLAFLNGLAQGQFNTSGIITGRGGGIVGGGGGGFGSRAEMYKSVHDIDVLDIAEDEFIDDILQSLDDDLNIDDYLNL